MSFATTHIASHLGKLYKSKEDTGDFTLTCQGEVIKAHSWILGMGSVRCSCDVNVIFLPGLSISRQP